MPDELLPNGTTVEFDSDGEGSLPQLGVVLNYMPPDDKFDGGYHVACYFVVPHEELQVLEEDDADFIALRTQAQGLCQKTGLDYHTVSALLTAGWRYVEKLGEISRWEHPMWQLDDRVVETPPPPQPFTPTAP
jgi:hypothetical protein